MEKSIERDRCYYVDWLRILGIICIFFFHNTRFFDLMDWEVKNKETFLEPTIFVMFISFWIMPLFFMLAGIGTRFALKTKTTIQYIKDRYWRLVVPYLFGIFILIPPQRYVESLSKGKFSGTFFDFLPWYPEHKLLIGNFGFSPVWFGEPGTHLWFLAFLFVFSILAVPVIRYLKNKSGERLIKHLATVSEKMGGIYLFVVPLVCVKIALQPIYPKYSSWADFTFWFLIFIFGYILFYDQRFVESADRHKYISLSIGILLLVLLLVLFIFFLDHLKQWWDHPDYSWGCIFFHAMWTITTWSWLMFFLGAGKAFLNFQNSWLSKLNEAVMPFYMLHQTIILLIGFQIIQWHMNAWLKYTVISSMSFMVIIAIYYLCIMRFNWLRILFGMKPLRGGVISQVSIEGKN
ncbi:acyltransferase family protein [Pelosinus fermentans]|uniref:Acyltransferase 3 n=1 Tax=Pelosinus fermentans JBW45 TaxID=1192197 RepID=I9NV83_9FIRM|nr:acyltransferase [Pelosinus fermentans]AJQ28469.1 acyltransferase 3 [Pelosinus fermentans JBW45]